MKRHLWIPVCALLALLAGCGGESEPEPASEADRTVDRLRSLGYAVSAPESVGEADGVTKFDPARSQPGINLYTIQNLSRAELIDERGGLLRSWQYTPASTWERAILLEHGDLIAIGADPPDSPGPGIPDDKRYIIRYDWHGRMRWRRALLAHHDVEQTPQGLLLALTFRRRSLPAIDPTIDTRDDLLTLLNDDGQVLESLSLLDAFSKSPGHPLHRVGPNTQGVRPWVDLFHANSVQWMRDPRLAKINPLFGPDNVLISSRHQNRIAIVSWTRRQVVWSWGFGELDGPHDAQVLPNGHILVFDNGLVRGWSRVIELDPIAGRITWEYRASTPSDFYTASKGSCQRLANGNTLIANSDQGKAFEVTPQGEIVWSFATPHRAANGERLAIVRMRRFDRSFIDALAAAAAKEPPS